jgi:hypothetical protein
MLANPEQALNFLNNLEARMENKKGEEHLFLNILKVARR